MIEFSDAAASLYGALPAPTPAPAGTDTPSLVVSAVAPPAPPAPPTDTTITSVPDAIREQRAQDDARKLYNAQVEFAVIPGKDEIAVELRECLADMGLNSKDIPVISHALNNPAQSDVDRTSMQAKAMQLLTREYGEDAQSALDDAKAFLKADPRRVALLDRAGDDPATVLLIARRARAAKAAGRI